MGSAPADNVYTDCSRECDAATRVLKVAHDVSTPNRPQTNAVVERAGRKVKETTAVTLL